MASSRRRTISSFSLSFLDIMFCGFGAVVLLVLIINSNTITRRQERVEELRSELLSELMRESYTNKLVRERSEQLLLEYDQARAALTVLQAKQAEIAGSIRQISSSLAPESRPVATKAEIARLQAELKELEEKALKMAEEKALVEESGRQVRPFEGDGHRQYLTGLKLGGKRVLILVDSSASMLDKTIVDIIRRKVMDEKSRRVAPKWRKVLSTVEWILANLPVDTTIQVYHFNETVHSLAPDGAPGWLAVTDSRKVDDLLAKLRLIAPIGATDLEAAFLKARMMSLPPDNIILLTDGLPTRRKGGRSARTIDSAGRVKLFDRAIRQLPPRVPVNTILFPIEGDPFAAVNYWQLAITSKGSFLTPARDWP